jgi:hypothetical protein
MLEYIMTSDKVASGHAYRFYPKFFTTREQDGQVEASDINHWMPAHPHDLRDAYTFEEEKIFRKKNADKLDPEALLTMLEQAISKHDTSSRIYQAALLVKDEGKKLSKEMSEDDIKKWKMSVVLAINLLEALKENPENAKEATYLLEANANDRAIGKSDGWKQFKGALLVLVGIVLVVLGYVGIPLTNGASLGLTLPGGSLVVCGETLFYRNMQKPFAEGLSTLAKEADRQLTYS